MVEKDDPDTIDDVNKWLAKLSKTQNKLTKEQANILAKKLASLISVGGNTTEANGIIKEPFYQKLIEKPPVQIRKSDPVCPYCKTVLDKAPRRKKKCSRCGNYIYVKPKQNLFSSIYLTKEQVVELNEYESIEHFKGKYEFEKARLLDYKQSGFEKVRISSGGGCEACIDIMGKILTIDDALKEMPIPVKECSFKLHGKIPGWCRCRYVAYFDDPELDTPDSFYEEQKRKDREMLKAVIE